MYPLTDDLLLQAWERGANRNPLGRALTMLACALPEREMEDLAAVSILERDRQLLQLHRVTFGNSIRGFQPCAHCGADLEFEVPIAPMLERPESARESTRTWQEGRFIFSNRAINSRDVAEALVDPAAARMTLLRRCTSVRTEDGSPAEDLLSDAEFEAAAVAGFEDLHRDTELNFSLRCPSCGHTQKAPLDIGQYLWAEIRAAAIALLREVHELARAYAWPEASILEMCPIRRRAYLEMVRA